MKQNVTVQDRPTRIEDNDCSVRRLSHNDKLWAVAWNRLFDAFFILYHWEGTLPARQVSLFLLMFFASQNMYSLSSNVTGQDRPTGCKNSDCSERKPSHNGSLWVVAWTRLFNDFCRNFMPGGRENRKNGLKIAFLGS